ncbi:Hypothetical predicted protein [Pelobates cultripes]|uniref:Uncharacterized protein n=1 Tax=Pelobates cultripes TaxID=61616 RepID=A0AAD1W3J6_PELCU|nr:Hypothetical predicted protein [Pelobates cultripes]
MPVCRSINRRTNPSLNNRPGEDNPTGDNSQDGRRKPAMCVGRQWGRPDAYLKARKLTEHMGKGPSINPPASYSEAGFMEAANEILLHPRGNARSSTYHNDANPTLTAGTTQEAKMESSWKEY